MNAVSSPVQKLRLGGMSYSWGDVSRFREEFSLIVLASGSHCIVQESGSHCIVQVGLTLYRSRVWFTGLEESTPRVSFKIHVSTTSLKSHFQTVTFDKSHQTVSFKSIFYGKSRRKVSLMGLLDHHLPPLPR